MFNENNVPGPEWRVRPVVRYVVTRYCHPYQHIGDGNGEPIPVMGGSEMIAEFASEDRAYEVAKALRLAEVDARPNEQEQASVA